MDAGDFIWFFFAIVAGDALVRVLSRLTDEVKNRGAQRLYPAAIIWQIFLLLLVIEIWIATAYYQRTTTTTIQTTNLMLFLCLPIGAVVLAELLNNSDDEDPAVYFNKQRRLFFLVLAALPILSFVRQIVTHDLSFGTDTNFQIALIVLALIGVFLRSRVQDLILAVVTTAVLASYIFVVYHTISI